MTTTIFGLAIATVGCGSSANDSTGTGGGRGIAGTSGAGAGGAGDTGLGGSAGGGSAVALLDGHWAGTTDEGTPISFDIVNGAVTNISMTLHIKSVSCTGSADFVAQGPVSLQSGSQFSVTATAVTMSSIIAGQFSSNAAGSGTFTQPGGVVICGGVADIGAGLGSSGTWTAARQSSGGVGGAGGATGAGGAAPTGGTGNCAAQVPSNGMITDFSDFGTPNKFGVDTSTGTFMDSTWGSIGLTGDLAFYQQSNYDGIQGTITSGAAVLSANIAAAEFAGVIFAFSPNCGSNACAFSGVSFSILGYLGGSSVDVQILTNGDYPKGLTRGQCDYVAAGASQWSYCKNPHVDLSSIVVGGVTSAMQTAQITWSMFTGGSPTGTADCSQLLGIQLQFNCPSTATTGCTPNVTIDNLRFY
jgi:hypothetical protein